MTTLKLSEAIRLGAMMRPQAYYAWFKDGGSCAIGAAIEAVGAATYPNTHLRKQSLVPKSWYWARAYVPCPVCGVDDEVQGHLRHINNDHRWTREQIADWVETIEAQQPASEPIAEPEPAEVSA